MGARVDKVMESAIAEGRIVGAELIVLRGGAPALRRHAGWLDREADRAMEPNAIYRLASVTKPIVAATALAMVEHDLLDLEDRVADHLPYFTPSLSDGTTPDITLHHLLTHTAGIGYRFPADPAISSGLGPSDADFEENFSRVARQPLLYPPGASWFYSAAIDVLGAVIAKVHGGSLEDAVRAFVTGPLGMTETGFFVADENRLAVPYADGVPLPVRMEEPHAMVNEAGDTVVFSPARIFSTRAFQSGGAGMAGTPEDIVGFLEMLRTGGGAVLHPETVARGFSNRIAPVVREDAGQSFGYFGAVVEDPHAANSPAAKGAVQWGGVYGHSWLIDPANELTLVSMSNTAFEGCNGAYPKDLIAAVYADLDL